MKRNSQLESCVLESDGDTEDEEDSDGKLTHTGPFHTLPVFERCTYLTIARGIARLARLHI